VEAAAAAAAAAKTQLRQHLLYYSAWGLGGRPITSYAGIVPSENRLMVSNAPAGTE